MSRFFTKTGAFYEKHKKGILLAAVIAAFIMTAAVYTFEEFYVDDFFYMKKFGTNEPIESIADIIAFQKMHYLWWGGRTPGDTILQLLLFMPRPLAGIIGACGFFALVYLICKNALNGQVTLPYFCLMLGMIYHLNSNFYETVEWYTGAGFYMWPMMFVMWACVPVYTWFKTGSFTPKWYHWLLLPVILFAGWSLENVGPTLLVILVLVIVQKYRMEKKIDIYFTVSAVLVFLGCILLLAAPGNYARGEGFSGGLMAIAYRGHGQINAWADWLFMPILTAVLAALAIHAKDSSYLKRDRLTQYSVLWFVMSVVIMIASPTFPERTTFTSLVIILPMILHLIEAFIGEDEKKRKTMHVLAFFLGLSFVLVMLSTGLLAAVRSVGVDIPH